MEAVICLEMLYSELEPERRIAKIAARGFSKIEFWGWRDKDIEALRTACQRHGVGVANFSGHRRGTLIAPAPQQHFFADLKEAVPVARRLGCTTLMLLSNELDEAGRALEPLDHLPDGEKYANLRGGLEQALAATPEEITLVLEPLNTKIDHPGYFLRDMATAVSLIRKIGHPRLKLLGDLYHLGVMGENLEAVIDRYSQEIGYVHVADFPGRHEPGTGAADWPALLKRLQERGYRGCVGFEYAPRLDSDASLEAIRDLWDGLCP